MNICRQLLLDHSVRIERFYHRQDEAHHDPEEEVAPSYTVNFIERGSYELLVGKKSWTLDERSVFITHPAMSFRYRHFEELPSDVCLAVVFDENFAEDIFRTDDFSPGNLFPVVSRNNRLAYLQWQISHLAETRDNALAIETLAAELLSALGSDQNKRNVYKTRQLSWYAERIDAARRLIESRSEDQHSLNSLSRFVGMSPFHFTRIFKELTSRSPHQFLISVRLSKAVELLCDGISVTEACFACGFTNLSHFIRLFQRTFGVTPAQFQRRKIKPQITKANSNLMK